MANPFPTLEVSQPTDFLPPIGTLLSTFDPIDTPDEHWELGYHFPTWGSCLSAFRWGPCSGELKEHGTGSSTVTAVPITVYAPFRCSTFGTGGDLGEYEAAALDALKKAGGQELEQELWSGDINLQNAWSNLYLTSPLAVNASTLANAYPWPGALAVLQKKLRACLGDTSGVIHASPALVSMWQMGYAVFEDGDGNLRDGFGNYVIAGSGYNGGAPAVNATTTLTEAGTGGSFTITVTDPISGDLETTAPIVWNASAATVQTALEALTIVDVGDVVCTGGILGAAPVVCTWGGRFARQVVTVSKDSTLITGGALTLTATAGGSVVADGIEYAYATSMIDVRVGEIQVIDPNNGASIDRSTNTVELIAEATMSATWDGCCHFYIKASIADAFTWPTA